MKIIVVDDNPHVLALMQKTLQKFGTVEAFHDAGDAFMRAATDQPDLIVTDFRLKGMDGRELVQGLRARHETEDIAVIMVASKPDIDEELQPLAELVDEFVAKPFF